MSHLTYLLVLLVVFVGSGWLEVVLGVRVWRRPVRLLLTLLPVVCVFYVWDVYAVSRQVIGPSTRVTSPVCGCPGDVPLEELLFFVVVPVASILTLEAVRRVRGWPLGDEGRA